MKKTKKDLPWRNKIILSNKMNKRIRLLGLVKEVEKEIEDLKNKIGEE